MRLLALLRRESDVSLRALLVMASVAGRASSLILPIINTAAKIAFHRESSFRLFLLFSITVAVYAIGQRRFMTRCIAEVELVLDRLRVRLADKIRHCDLGPLEEIGRTVLYADRRRKNRSRALRGCSRHRADRRR
jgi:putative ATP-binding cassette transporter